VNAFLGDRKRRLYLHSICQTCAAVLVGVALWMGHRDDVVVAVLRVFMLTYVAQGMLGAWLLWPKLPFKRKVSRYSLIKAHRILGRLVLWISAVSAWITLEHPAANATLVMIAKAAVPIAYVIVFTRELMYTSVLFNKGSTPR